MTAKTGQSAAGARQSPARLEDVELARLAQKEGGQQVGEVFAELYRRHFNRVYGYHFLRTGNIDDAQDLTSQTFMAALESIHRFKGQGTFAAWLMSIAHHKMAMHFRSKRPETGLETAEALPHPGLLPEDQAHQHGLLRRVGAAMRVLTPDRADAFVLRVFGGLSAAETASVLGKSEAAVKMLVLRAVQEICAKLEVEFVVEER